MTLLVLYLELLISDNGNFEQLDLSGFIGLFLFRNKGSDCETAFPSRHVLKRRLIIQSLMRSDRIVMFPPLLD